MNDWLFPTLSIIALIALTGFFVAAEFALIGTPRTLMEKEVEEGGGIARRVLQILTDPKKQDRFIATAQLGITLASLGLGMYGEHTLALWIGEKLSQYQWTSTVTWISAHGLASVIAVCFLTYFHIVLGEMIPKSMALQDPGKVVKWVVPFMAIFQAMTFPFIVLMNGIGNTLLRMVGVRRGQSAEHYRTAEELSYLVDESETGGKLGKESASVLRDLLEFGDLTAGEVMVPRTQIVGIPTGSSGPEVQAMLRKSPHTRYVIYEGDIDRIVGFVHVKDLLRHAHSPVGVPANVIRPVPFVPESSSLESVLAAMRKARSQLTVVMDEHGGTAGLLTVEDLFEEVVGEISENSLEKFEIYRDPEGNLHALGTVRLADLGEELGITLEHESVDTVSGLILASFERPAQVGDRTVFEGVEFEVIAVKGRGVRECLVRWTPPETTPAAGIN
jgi:CBS domain containing-hemolysin-like protein